MNTSSNELKIALAAIPSPEDFGTLQEQLASLKEQAWNIKATAHRSK